MADLRIAGVVVLYHPDITLMNNINSFLNEIELLYLIDNSEEVKNDLLDELIKDPKIIYLKNPTNLGVAEALNIAATAAIKKSFDFLLTMDQDSSFKTNEFKTLLYSAKQVNREQVAIISPLHGHPLLLLKKRLNKLNNEEIVMTSGNLLNLSAYKQIGPFSNELFIDHVDHEYCLRLTSLGYRIVVVNDVILNHSLGQVRIVCILKMPVIRFVSHTPVRTYYMIRNGLFVANKFKKINPGFYKKNLVLIAKEFVKITFERNKLERLKLAFLAIKHYRASQMGKIRIQ